MAKDPTTRNFALCSITEEEHRVVRVSLPPETISVLTQVRRTLDVDAGSDLCVSILEHGQQVPGVAATLAPDEAERYIGEINAIYDSHHALETLAPICLDAKVFYVILAAGHRRHKACVLINQEVEKGALAYSENYRGAYRVELHFGLSAKEAIALQFNENRHVQVPPQEEARAAWRFYRWLQTQDPCLTTAQFARIIGRSKDWVRGALRFCRLPLSVQAYVDGADGYVKLPYGILVELARLSEGHCRLTGEEFCEGTYHRWVRQALLKRFNASTFGKMVSEYLAEKTAECLGQLPLFGLERDLGADQRPLRRVVGKELVPALWLALNYWQTLEQIRKSGGFGDESYLGPETDPALRALYCPGSPLRLPLRHAEHMTDLVPYLVELAQREGGRYRLSLVRAWSQASRSAPCRQNACCNGGSFGARHHDGPSACRGRRCFCSRLYGTVYICALKNSVMWSSMFPIFHARFIFTATSWVFLKSEPWISG